MLLLYTTIQNQVFNFSEDISGSPVSFTIIYSDSTTNAVCLQTTISASSCENGVCNHVFVPSLSDCPTTADIDVSAFATNLLGDGMTSNAITIASGSYKLQRIVGLFHMF